jgi:predicted negative regulator of RcsB-dependent stress response
LGGLFGGIRRSKQVKEDVSMHRREREIGLEVNVDPATSERRAKVEKFVNKMEKASGLITAITTAKEAYEQSATPENRAQLLQALANAESRMSVSATRQRGLIEYDGETGLERSAMNLMKEIAEGKVLVGVADISTTAEYKRAMRV